MGRLGCGPVEPRATCPPDPMPFPSTVLRRLVRLAASLAALPLAAPATAQSYVQDARAVATVPAMLGRGDAGVALPTRETSFFVNPAHVAATEGKFHLSLFGLGAGGTAAAVDVVRQLYYRETTYEFCDLNGDGQDDYCETSAAVDGAALAAETRRPLGGHGTLLLPSVSFRSGSLGVSAGTFLQSTVRVQSAATATGDSLYAFMQTDGIAAVTVSATLPAYVTVGAGLRYVRRFASTDDFDAADTAGMNDPAYAEAGGVAFDAGAFWRTPVAGLDAALAVYNLGAAMDYVPSEFFGGIGSDVTLADAEGVAANMNRRGSAPSFRAGFAYRPTLPESVPFQMVLLADYVSASTTTYVQSAVQHLRLGAEAQISGAFAARAGFGGGGPSLGATLNLRVLKLDYALYSQRSGRFEAGEDGGFRHALLLRLGLD